MKFFKKKKQPMPQPAIVTELFHIAEFARTYGVDDPEQVKDANLNFIQGIELVEDDDKERKQQHIHSAYILDDDIREVRQNARSQQNQQDISQSQIPPPMTDDDSSLPELSEDFVLPPEISLNDPMIQEALLAQRLWERQRRRQQQQRDEEEVDHYSYGSSYDPNIGEHDEDYSQGEDDEERQDYHHVAGEATSSEEEYDDSADDHTAYMNAGAEEEYHDSEDDYSREDDDVEGGGFGAAKSCDVEEDFVSNNEDDNSQDGSGVNALVQRYGEDIYYSDESEESYSHDEDDLAIHAERNIGGSGDIDDDGDSEHDSQLEDDSEVCSRYDDDYSQNEDVADCEEERSHYGNDADDQGLEAEVDQLSLHDAGDDDGGGSYDRSNNDDASYDSPYDDFDDEYDDDSFVSSGRSAEDVHDGSDYDDLPIRHSPRQESNTSGVRPLFLSRETGEDAEELHPFLQEHYLAEQEMQSLQEHAEEEERELQAIESIRRNLGEGEEVHAFLQEHYLALQQQNEQRRGL
jgi:hypothetical protein